MPSISETRAAYWAAIEERGPTRVATGGATSKAHDNDYIDVIYIRNDGWSLGASMHLRAEAESLWSDRWIGVVEAPFIEAQPYPPLRSAPGVGPTR